MKTIIFSALTAMAMAVCSAALAADAKQDANPAATMEVKQEAKPEVKLSDIPSITTPDRTPHACVDCHKIYSEMKIDGRLTTVLAKWKNGADPKFLEKAKAAAPEGRTLTGKHPDVSALVKVIPDDC